MNDQGINNQCVPCFSFKGVIVGALVAFGLMFLFNLLTVGGGLASYTKTEAGLQTLIVIAYCWMVVGSFVIFYLSGLIATWLAHPVNGCEHCKSILHGLVTWVVYIIVSLVLLSGAPQTMMTAFPQVFFIPAAEEMADTGSTMQSAVSSFSSSKAMAKAEKADISQATSPAVQREAHKIGLATLAAFFIFFVQVIGSCFGAWCGMEFRRCYVECKK